MADLLSLVTAPLLGRLPFGPPAPLMDPNTQPDVFAPPDRTTLAGMPVLPLAMGGLAAGLGALLAKKGYGRQAALQLFPMGYNIGNVPILREQQQYDQMLKAAQDRGELTTTAPVPEVPYAQPRPVTSYGGVPLYRTPQVSVGEVFRGAGLPAGLASQRLPVSAGLLEAALKNAEGEQFKDYLVGQGLPSNTPPAIAQAIINEKRKIAQIPELLRLAGKPGPTQAQRIEIGPNGPQVVTETPSQAELERQKNTDIFNQTYRTAVLAGQTQENAARQAEATARKAEADARMQLINKQLEELKTKPSGVLAKRLDAARNQNATDLKLLGELRDETTQQVRPGYEPLYNEVLGRVRESGQMLQSLTTALDEKLAEEGGMKVTPKAPEETPEEKTLNDQKFNYLREMQSLPDPAKRAQLRPKDPQAAAVWDQANQEYLEFVQPALDDLRAHMATRNFLQRGPDPSFDAVMKARYGWQWDAAKKLLKVK